MANTLSNLIPDAYAALDVVSRELVGFIPAVTRDSRADMVALNQTLRSFATPSNSSAADITPAMSIPSIANQTIANKTLTISKSRHADFSWSGEEQYSMDKGPGARAIIQDQIAQAYRALVNEIEVDIATALAAGSSRAYGATAGTAPVLADFANAKKILDDNGAPLDRTVVMDTTAGVSLRGTSNLYKVNEGGDESLLRQGLLGNLYGFALRESAQVQTPTSGTASGATTDNAGYAIGTTTLTLASAGTGTILAGDIVTFAGDTNKYVVISGDSDVSNGGTITIAAPGLKKAMSAATKAITVFGTSTRNCAFSRNSVVLATRLPVAPAEGDLALDRQVVTDPRSGISFEISMYPGYRCVTYQVSACWGVSVIKPEHAAIIIG